MIKVRIQGTPEEMEKFVRKLGCISWLRLIDISDVFPNKETKKYFRRYFQIELKHE